MYRIFFETLTLAGEPVVVGGGDSGDLFENAAEILVIAITHHIGDLINLVQILPQEFGGLLDPYAVQIMLKLSARTFLKRWLK